MIPTSIDGTDITGATIDGTDVTEITVDGDTVFSAGQTLPVAYSNLVAWYPFDSATYGGSNTDDVTAILGGSGDDTDYSMTGSATYLSSGGVNDINAGGSSGAFEFNGSTDDFEANNNFTVSSTTQELSYNVWVKRTANNDFYGPILSLPFGSGSDGVVLHMGGKFADNEVAVYLHTYHSSNFVATTDWHMITFVIGNGSGAFYIDGNTTPTNTFSDTIPTGTNQFEIGGDWDSVHYYEGIMDDARVYNKKLTTPEISQIYQNTDPN